MCLCCAEPPEGFCTERGGISVWDGTWRRSAFRRQFCRCPTKYDHASCLFAMCICISLDSDPLWVEAGVLTDGNAASSGQTPAQEQLRPTGSSGYHQVSHPLGPHYIADAAALAAPAVVNITVTQDGVPIPQDQSGTGFIFTSDGSILTNAHVVADALAERSLSHQNASSSSSSSSSRIRSDAPKPITVALQDGRIFQGSVIMFDRCKASACAFTRSICMCALCV